MESSGGLASDKTLVEQGIMKLAKTKGGRFFQNWANNTVHEYAEEGVQAGISTVLESATGKDTTTGQQEFGSLEAAGTTAASVAFMTAVFTLAGLGADVDPILTEYEQSNFEKARQMTAEVIDSTIESEKLAQENVSFLNKLKANMVTTETISTDSGDISVQTQNGEIFVPSIVDVDTLAKSNLGDTMVKLLDYANQNKNINVDAAVDSYYEYISASEEAKPEAYQKAVQAVKSSINNAIEILHAKGTDVSSLEQVKSQVEADSQSYEKYARFNYKAQQAPADKEQQADIVADVEAALTRISKQNGDLGIDALHDAYYHGYLTGGGDIQPAVKMAMRSIDMALASGEVSVGDKAALREMRAQLTQTLDEQGESGYNEKEEFNGAGRPKAGTTGEIAYKIRIIDDVKDAALVRRVKELRSVFTGLYEGGNFGYTEVNINGLNIKELYAHSGIDFYKEVQNEEFANKIRFISKLYSYEESLFKPLWVNRRQVINGPDAYLRNVDTEAKMLETLARLLGNNRYKFGTIKIYTERRPCPSCLRVIKEFNERYPDIVVVVIHNNGKNLISKR